MKEMALDQLLEGIVNQEIADDICIRGIQNDSRKVSPGDLFIAYQGSQAHGVEFIEQAQRKGAVAVLCDEQCALSDCQNLFALRVSGLRDQLGLIADRFYNHPSANIPVIAVTGTDGKTSVTHFIAQTLNSAGKQCGLIGTLGSGLLNHLTASSNTTPSALFIHQFTCELIAKGGDCLVLEASSHGIDQGRLNGLSVDVAVFTNISLDHLDYHVSLDDYIDTKCRLFEQFDLSYAVINCGSAHYERFLSACSDSVQIIKYALFDDSADIFLNSLTTDANGTHMNINAFGESLDVQTEVLGKFNAENILATLAVLHTQDVNLVTASEHLSKLQAVNGRMQIFRKRDGTMIVLDYAHTPNALEKVLRECRDYCMNNLICVFGCGGDRDSSKRSAMGSVAEAIADKVILTDDNPRYENPEKIISDIQSGIKRLDGVDVIRDREQAVHKAIAQASEGDVVVIAGKGHETHQIVGDKMLRSNDAELIASAIGSVS